MTLAQSILSLLKDEGYRTNEAIEDAVEEFVSLVEDENENLADTIDDEEVGVEE